MLHLEPVRLKRKNGYTWPLNRKNEAAVSCLVVHDFMGFAVLTYHGGRRRGWYARDEHIYSEKLIRAAWELPGEKDALSRKGADGGKRGARGRCCERWRLLTKWRVRDE